MYGVAISQYWTARSNSVEHWNKLLVRQIEIYVSLS